MWCSSTLALNWQHSSVWWTMPLETLRWNIEPPSTQPICASICVRRGKMAKGSCFHVCQVWRIENLELADVKPSTYGQFYGGDCYLVLYTYQKVGQQQHILYMWQVSVTIVTISSHPAALVVVYKSDDRKFHEKTFSNSIWLNLTLCLFSIRAAMPLQMRSPLAPTRLSTLITSTMEPRFRSGWSWERSPATSWLFSKENSLSLRWDFFYRGDLLHVLGWEKALVFNFSTKLMVLILQNCGEILFPKREAVVPLTLRKT